MIRAEGSDFSRGMNATIRSVNESDYTIEAIVSDDTVDRHESIIAKTAWDKNLSSYLANPVLCWGHPVGRGQPVGPEDLIGKAVAVKTTPEGLFCKFQYAVKENERAALIWRMVVGGFLRMYSVGARVLEWVDIWSSTEEIAALDPSYREILATGKAYEVITEAELLEVSQVFVGSNRNAIARAYRAGLLDRRGVDLLCPSNRIPTIGRIVALPACRSVEAPTEVSPEVSEPLPEAGTEPVEPTEDEQFEFEQLLDQDPEFAEAFAEVIAEILEEDEDQAA